MESTTATAWAWAEASYLHYITGMDLTDLTSSQPPMSRTSGEARCLNAREEAPGLSSVDMFSGDSSLSSKGPLSVAVPGEIAGYWEARWVTQGVALLVRCNVQETTR